MNGLVGTVGKETTVAQTDKEAQTHISYYRETGLLVGSDGKEPACTAEDLVHCWVGKSPWRRQWVTHSSILNRIMDREKPCGLQSMGLWGQPPRLSD